MITAQAEILPLDLNIYNPQNQSTYPSDPTSLVSLWLPTRVEEPPAHEHNRSNLLLRCTAGRRTLHSDLQLATPTTPSRSPKLLQLTTPTTPSCSLKLSASLAGATQQCYLFSTHPRAMRHPVPQNNEPFNRHCMQHQILTIARNAPCLLLFFSPVFFFSFLSPPRSLVVIPARLAAREGWPSSSAAPPRCTTSPSPLRPPKLSPPLLRTHEEASQCASTQHHHRRCTPLLSRSQA